MIMQSGSPSVPRNMFPVYMSNITKIAITESEYQYEVIASDE